MNPNPSATIPLRPVAILAAEMLVDEAVGQAKKYFVDLRRPPGWITDTYDPHHRQHLASLAEALLDETVDLGGLIRWLPEQSLLPAFHRCRRVVSDQEPTPSLDQRMRELQEVLEPPRSDPARSELAAFAKTLARSCLRDIRRIVGDDGGSRARRALGGLQWFHEKTIAALGPKSKHPNKNLWQRAPSIQAFYRLQSALNMPQVRRFCVEKILQQIQQILGDLAREADPERGENGSGPSTPPPSEPPTGPGSPEAQVLSAEKVLVTDQEPRAGEEPRTPIAKETRASTNNGLQPPAGKEPQPPEVADPGSIKSSAAEPPNLPPPVPPPLPAESPAGDDEKAVDPGAPPSLAGCSCFGFPFVRRAHRHWRKLELVPDPGSTARTAETDRSPLSCTIPTLRIPGDASRPGLSATFESGYRLEDLLDLETAYRAFKQTPKPWRELEAGPVESPPLLPASLPITCGRPDCSGDIAELDRTERVCPHCNRTILSRCGWADCSEEHLHLDIHGQDLECPGCGKTNRNLYWRCEEHPEQGFLSTTRDLCCPACLHQELDRSVPRRPERIRSQQVRCPGCSAEGTRARQGHSRRPFLVPQRILPLVLSPTTVERSQKNLELCRATGLSDDGECPVCRARLVPFVELGNECARARHLSENLRCGCCGFSLEPAAKSCPRCWMKVAVCPVCEVLPTSDSCHGPTRPPEVWIRRRGLHTECERCATWQFPLRHGLDLTRLDGQICRNVYGCPIGGGLASSRLLVLAALGLQVCPVCEDPELLPLDFQAFRAEVLRCAFCSVALGDPHRWNTDRLESGLSIPQDERELFLEAMRQQEHACRLCGRGRHSPPDPSPPDAKIQMATLELGKALWVAKTPETALGWLRDHWLGFQSPLDPRTIRDLLLAQTAHSLHPLLCKRLEDLEPVFGSELRSSG